MMQDSQTFQKVHLGYAKRREMQLIKNNARLMTYSLKDKAEASEIKNKHILSHSKNKKRSVTTKIVGSKIDLLV